jgi:phage terminase large subunit
MPLNAGQQEVSSSPARFRVVIAGRRWGKTHMACRELARFARYPDRRIWYIAPSYRMAKQIAWDHLKARLYELNWIAKVNESDLSIRLVNGSQIALRGADNPDSLRGVFLDFCVFDEFAMIDEKAWTEVIRPALSDRQGSAMFISTPMGRNWAFDLYNRGVDKTEHSWESFTYTTLEGGNVTEAEIESARTDMDERQFKQEYLASFETYEGVIYYNFSRANVTEAAQIPRTVIIGMDFNVSPAVAVCMMRTEHGLHIFDEIVMYSSNTDEMVSEINRRFGDRTIIVYPDPAGAQRKTSAGGRTDITILQQAGYQVKYKPQHPAVRDRINAVNALLCNADGQRRLFVDPRCRKTIESLEKQTYKQDTLVPNKDDGYDHMNDALGYAVEMLFPIRRTNIEQREPERWGFRTL